MEIYIFRLLQTGPAWETPALYHDLALYQSGTLSSGPGSLHIYCSGRLLGGDYPKLIFLATNQTSSPWLSSLKG